MNFNFFFFFLSCQTLVWIVFFQITILSKPALKSSNACFPIYFLKSHEMYSPVITVTTLPNNDTWLSTETHCHACESHSFKTFLQDSIGFYSQISERRENSIPSICYYKKIKGFFKSSFLPRFIFFLFVREV